MATCKLICYYSDLYRSLKKELSIRIIIVDSTGKLVVRKSMNIQDVYPVCYAKFICFKELFSCLEELERKKGKRPIDIISFDKKSISGFIDIQSNNESSNIVELDKLRSILKLHDNWSIRYENKSRDIFKKLYSQSMLKCIGKKLKGYKLPRKKRTIRKTIDAIGSKCENLAFFDVEMNCIDKVDNTLGYWEVISIGVVKYNIKTKEISRFYRVIKPQIQTVLSERCIKITGLNQEEVDSGISYKIAMDELQKWIGSGKTVFLSWGREDIKALKSNSKLSGNENNLIFQIRKRYVDFQKEFSYYHLKNNQVVSLVNALTVYDLEFQGEQHNALNDSYNLFKVYEKYTCK